MSLTSFETILLDCIVIAVISTRMLKKLIKISEFLCSHFNIEGGRKQHFQHIMLYYLKKGKTATETQKRFVQCMENVLSLTDCVKVVCEVSCWGFLTG